jgi:glucosamine--fructose-6-phosphate aminotransferase (isomerizing)
MCGIVGYAGDRRAAEIVFDGLRNLEYRGYDSVGIATLCGGEIITEKMSGRVDGLKDRLPYLDGGTGIGHTRWATHGQPSYQNAHPHTAGAFAVVHNGIIENFALLKEELISHGATFSSETDSEVVVHLLNYYYDGDVLTAVAKTVARLKGTFAIAILCKDFDGVIVAKYKSSAIIGFGGGANYVASDIPALPVSVNKICILQDGDIAVITRADVEIYDGKLNKVTRDKIAIALKHDNLDLMGNPHYMLKEIREGAKTIRDTCTAMPRCDEGRLVRLINEADCIIFVGCGTAYNSGLVGKYYFEKAGYIARADIASELKYSMPEITSRTLVFVISQSGETADTLQAAEALKGGGAKIIAVTNSPYSALTRLADMVVPVCAGSEICVAATKSYIGQITCLYCLNKMVQSQLDKGICALQFAATALEKVIESEGEALQVARLCVKSKAVFYLGRGLDYAVAVEGSLKLKEVSYIFSDAYPAGELKHGTLALVDEETLSVIVVSDESMGEKCLSTAEEIISRKGKVVVITTVDSVAGDLAKIAEYVYKLPKIDKDLSAIVLSAALQLVAYHSAVLLGRNPDKPRNLAKSVTVE